MSLFPSSFNSLGKQYLREQRNINLKQDKKYNEGLKTFFGAPTPSNWKYDMSSTKVIFNGNDNPSFAEILNKNEKGEYLQKVMTTLRERKAQALIDEQARLDAELLAQAQAQAQADAERLAKEEADTLATLERERNEEVAKIRAEEDAKKIITKSKYLKQKESESKGAEEEKVEQDESNDEDLNFKIRTTPLNTERKATDKFIPRLNDKGDPMFYKVPTNHKIHSPLEKDNQLRIIGNEYNNTPSKASSLLTEFNKTELDDEEVRTTKQPTVVILDVNAELSKKQTVTQLNALLGMLKNSQVDATEKQKIKEIISINNEAYLRIVNEYRSSHEEARSKPAFNVDKIYSALKTYK